MIITKRVEVPDVEYTREGQTLKIYQEQDPIDPRTWDNNGIMICSHGRYTLGDEEFNAIDFAGWAGLKAHLEDERGAYVVLPLYLYDHSGLSMSTTPYSSSWDSGQVGYIYTTKEHLRKRGFDEIPSKKQVKEWLRDEVKTYNQYLRGDVYRFVLEDCNKNVTASCGGFYGTDWESNALLDHAGLSSLDDWEEQ